MREETVRPGGAGHRRVPAVAHGELPRQRIEDRKLAGPEAAHDLPRIGLPAAGRIRCHEPAVNDRRISAAGGISRAGAAELLKNLGEFVAGIEGRSIAGRLPT